MSMWGDISYSNHNTIFEVLFKLSENTLKIQNVFVLNFRALCNHHHNPISEHFPHSKTDPWCSSAISEV
jgi:hypothetical protein